MKRTTVAMFAAGATVAVTAAIAGFVSRAEPQKTTGKATTGHELSIDGPYAYSVEYLGITCGQMTLESRLEQRDGRPAYHITMTARNSKFFNKIYRVDGRIESWVDLETMTTIAYESDITKKGERETRRYHVDRAAGLVTADKHGEVTTIPYEGGPALDPLAYVYRGRQLADAEGKRFSINLLTDKGVFETESVVGERKVFSTYDGKRELQRVQPVTADGEMFSEKGEFVYWIDPGPTRTLYRLDFKLGFGRLLAKLTGPADGPADRRMEAEAADPDVSGTIDTKGDLK